MNRSDTIQSSFSSMRSRLSRRSNTFDRDFTNAIASDLFNESRSTSPFVDACCVSTNARAIRIRPRSRARRREVDVDVDDQVSKCGRSDDRSVGRTGGRSVGQTVGRTGGQSMQSVARGHDGPMAIARRRVSTRRRRGRSCLMNDSSTTPFGGRPRDVAPWRSRSIARDDMETLRFEKRQCATTSARRTRRSRRDGKNTDAIARDILRIVADANRGDVWIV